MNSKVIAILCADIHLSMTAPIARCGEIDWYAAMARPLDEIKELAKTCGCPVICSGDVFHHSRSSPELINFAIDHLPEMYAVPGQHDLPLHSLEDIHKSAYHTLVKTGIITPLKRDGTLIGGNAREKIFAFGFPWGTKLEQLPRKIETKKPGYTYICVQHAYRWLSSHIETGFVGAPSETDLGKQSIRSKYDEYDIVLFGDNHTFWASGKYYNPGSLMRRNSDQVKHTPNVGLLYGDGGITPHYLHGSSDWITATPEPVGSLGNIAMSMGLENLINEMRDVQGATLDFKETIIRALDVSNISPDARRVVMEALDNAKRTQRA